MLNKLGGIFSVDIKISELLTQLNEYRFGHNKLQNSNQDVDNPVYEPPSKKIKKVKKGGIKQTQDVEI